MITCAICGGPCGSRLADLPAFQRPLTRAQMQRHEDAAAKKAWVCGLPADWKEKFSYTHPVRTGRDNYGWRS